MTPLPLLSLPLFAELMKHNRVSIFDSESRRGNTARRFVLTQVSRTSFSVNLNPKPRSLQLDGWLPEIEFIFFP